MQERTLFSNNNIVCIQHTGSAYQNGTKRSLQDPLRLVPMDF